MGDFNLPEINRDNLPYILADRLQFFPYIFFLNIGATNPLDLRANRHQVG